MAFVGENRRSRVFRTVAAQVVRRTAEGLGLEWCEQMPDIVDALAMMPASGDSLTTTPSASTYDIELLASAPGAIRAGSPSPPSTLGISTLL
jgi:hypothetical protein